ncbi:MAG: Tfp pilus assembly protein FimT/FimU [Desulfatibacillaceae bacterium]
MGPGGAKAHSARWRQPWGGRGFTLLELTVVMAIMAMAFMVALPRINTVFLEDDMEKFVRWIITSVRDQRDRAVTDSAPVYMYVDFPDRLIGFARPAPPSGDTWEAVFDEEKRYPEKQGGEAFPETVKVTDVEFPRRGRISFDTAWIRISEKGYISQAAIHLENEDGDVVTLYLEPFLGRVRRVDEYAGFDVY